MSETTGSWFQGLPQAQQQGINPLQQEGLQQGLNHYNPLQPQQAQGHSMTMQQYLDAAREHERLMRQKQLQPQPRTDIEVLLDGIMREMLEQRQLIETLLGEVRLLRQQLHRDPEDLNGRPESFPFNALRYSR